MIRRRELAWCLGGVAILLLVSVLAPWRASAGAGLPSAASPGLDRSEPAAPPSPQVPSSVPAEVQRAPIPSTEIDRREQGPAARFLVTVVDTAGQPIAGARLFLSHRRGKLVEEGRLPHDHRLRAPFAPISASPDPKTDVEGHYEWILPGAASTAEGWWSICASAEGFVSDPGMGLAAPPEGGSREVRIVLSPGRRIQGQVVGLPPSELAKLRIYFMEADAASPEAGHRDVLSPEADGRFELLDAPIAALDLSVRLGSSDRFSGWSRRVEAWQDELVLRLDESIEARPGRLRVQLHPTDRSYEGHSLSLLELDTGTCVARIRDLSAGVAEFEFSRGGRHCVLLTPDDDGSWAADEELLLAPGQDERLTLRSHRAARITIAASSLRDPAPELRIGWRSADRWWEIQRRSLEDAPLVVALPAGSSRLQAVPVDSFESTWEWQGDLSAGQERSLRPIVD